MKLLIKRAMVLALWLLLVPHSQAQTNQPIRLAVVVESPEVLTAADMLTVELSKNPGVQLLERTEIEKVYREQSLSAGNRDYLKLGQILGADGLWLFEVDRTPTQTNLLGRLIAVKPGVTLLNESFSWPFDKVDEWASSASAHIQPFIPKLKVLAKDAIPISVVNLRSAVSSTDSLEAERQLKLLVIQRLSREQRLFVLERQRMNLLSEEKSLNGMDDTAFWNGSYLLEGVVDQNGYSKDTITINARLTPARGGAPISFEVSGPRTNLAEVINRLTLKLSVALSVAPTFKEWNAADEAAQYFTEGQWALKWGVFKEAQSAADSAWALGKQDLECASLRMKAYTTEITSDFRMQFFHKESHGFGGVYRMDGTPAGPPPSDAHLQEDIREMLREHPRGLVHKISKAKSGYVASVDYVYADTHADPREIDRALHLLELYQTLIRNLPDGGPKIAKVNDRPGHWQVPELYSLGLAALDVSSETLQRFSLDPDADATVTGKLAELRASVRRIATEMFRSPSIHQSYFVADEYIPHDELASAIIEPPSIFRSAIKWGGFWQDKPEDAIALYRDLMSSPVFGFLQIDFWFRELELPRVVGWNENDRKRIPAVWDNFVHSLDVSTNRFFRLEASALTLVDAGDEEKRDAIFTNLCREVFDTHGEFAYRDYDLVQMGWGLQEIFFDSRVSDGVKQWYRSHYNQNNRVYALEREYWDSAEARMKAVEVTMKFEAQKGYLTQDQPHDPQKFESLFPLLPLDYTTNQAAEMLPLILAYKSNLVAASATNAEMRDFHPGYSIFRLTDIERRLQRILQIPVTPLPPSRSVQQPAPKQTPLPDFVVNLPEKPAKQVAPFIQVHDFLPIPTDLLPGSKVAGLEIAQQRWTGDRLLLELWYSAYNPDNEYMSSPDRFYVGAVFDPANKTWLFAEYPGDHDIPAAYDRFRRDMSGKSFELYRGNFYLSADSHLKKYDFRARRWEEMTVAGVDDSQLFVLGDRFIAANAESIVEILDGGKSTRILASVRRRPAVSSLDSLDSLGSPVLFTNAVGALGVSVGGSLYYWATNDWCSLPVFNHMQPTDVFPDLMVFRDRVDSGRESATLWSWDKNSSNLQLCLVDKPHAQPGVIYSPSYRKVIPPGNPRWESLAGDYLTTAPVAFYRSNLYFFVEEAVVTNIDGTWTVAEKDGCHAKLVCLCPDQTQPVVLPLKFDLSKGTMPSSRLAERLGIYRPGTAMSVRMVFAGDKLYLGQSECPGLWTIPVPEIEAAMAAEKERVNRQKVADVAAWGDQKQGLLAKYDLNHNGIIDPDERETALEDPVYIESELDNIDTNHDGFLTLPELAWFDANTNKLLDTKEQMGINIAETFYARKDMTKYDANGDGYMDQAEFENVFPMSVGQSIIWHQFGHWDKNHDGKLDITELTSFLLFDSVYVVNRRGTAVINNLHISRADDPNQVLKGSLDYYLQNPADFETDANGFIRRPRPGLPPHTPNGGPP